MTENIIGQQNLWVPVYQWTYTGNKVLLLRCDTRGYGGFQWPKSGKTICPEAKKNRELAQIPDCESGGLFGWPWGFGVGEGKHPNYRTDWIVFSANPEDVIWVDGKAKAIGEVEIVYCGSWYECQKILEDGRRAWIVQNLDLISTEKNRSFAFTHENYFFVLTSGDLSFASTSGDYSPALTKGHYSSASTSGKHSSAFASGVSSSAFASGPYSSASTTRHHSSAFTSGSFSSASTSGYYSSASTSGHQSSVFVTGSNSVASSCGDDCLVVALGDKSIVAVVGKNPTIEVGENCVGVVYADEFVWIVHRNSTVLQKCSDGSERLFHPTEDMIKNKKVRVKLGEIKND